MPRPLSATAPASVRSTASSPRWLLLLAGLLLLYRLDYAPFWNPDEGRYASSALEMIQPLDAAQPDWVIPHLNTIPRLNKPPLVYWVAATCFRLLGPSETAGRLGSALAAVGVMLVIWALGRAMFSEIAGVLGAVVWVTSALAFTFARVLNTDMLLSGAIALTFCGIWFALESEADTRRSWLPYGVAGLGMGLALLSKGPVGVALPLLIVFSYLTLARRWPQVAPAKVLSALGLALLLGAPWYWAVEQRHPGFLHDFLIVENFSRFSGHREFHQAKPIWWYLPMVLIGMFPWSAFLIPALSRTGKNAVQAPEQRPEQQQQQVQQRGRLFLWLWAGLWIAFFSLSKVKLGSYILPALPALALLMGAALEQLALPARARRTRLVLALTMLVYGLIALVLPVVLLREHISLLGRDRRLLAGKIMPAAEMQPYVIAITAMLVTGLLALAWSWRDRNVWRIVLTQAATGAVSFVLLVGLASHIARYEDVSPMVQALAPRLQPGDRFIEYQGYKPATTYYLRRPATVIGYVTNSGLDEAAMERSPLFFRDDARTLPQLLSDRQRVYILLRKAMYHLQRPASAPYIVAANNDEYIISNYPAPPGLHFDFQAPRAKSHSTQP